MSFSSEPTLPRTFNPISDRDTLLAKLEEIAGTLEEDLADTGWSGKTITLKYKLNTFQCKPLGGAS